MYDRQDMAKSIVKAHWLPFSGITSGLRDDLQVRILDGCEDDEALKLAPISGEELAFIREKSAQVEGRPSLLLELLEHFDAPESGDENLRLERRFLKGYALSRLGRAAEAQTLFQSLPRTFQPKILVEKGLEKLNQGELSAAEGIFKDALERGRGEFDPFTACTLYGGLSLALIHQGQFREAELCIDERRKILARTPSRVLSFGTRLYEILFLLERNNFDLAADLLAKTLGEVHSESINNYFILNLKLRLLLARNELGQAETHLERLRETARALNLAEGVLDFRIEEIELLLRRNATDEAQAKIATLRQDPLKKRDQFLRFRIALLQAVASIQKRNSEKALKEIVEAIDLGEANRYRPWLTWAFFHAAGIAIASGQPVQAKLFLNRGRKLSSEIGLRVRLACFSYMTEVIESRYATGSALISLAKHQEIGPELEYFLDAYRLLDVLNLTVISRERREMLAEPQLRRLLFKEPGVFWFQKESVLLSNHGDGRVELVEWPALSPLLAAFRLFWNDLQTTHAGLNLSDVHQARSPHPYRPELHESSAKMQISRLRKKIKNSKLSLKFDRDIGRYQLLAELPPFTIQSGLKPTATKLSGRKEELLERIGMEPFVSTKALCEEFKVTRQALHPFLRALQEEGKIRVVKRGPVSGYILR